MLEGPVVPVTPHPAMAQQELAEPVPGRVRSMTMSARARHRSRTASSAGVGTRTEVSWPARNSTASRGASRRSVLTRSPGRVGINDGAITSQRIPTVRNMRASS